MTFKMKHADKIVGFFILVALVFMISVMIVILLNKRIFIKDPLYKSEFNTAKGLTVNMPIKLSGFEIGQLKTIDLNDENKVDVTFIIYKKWKDKITLNSVLDLSVSPIGIGSEGLVLYPGRFIEGTENEGLPSGSFVFSTQSLEGKELIASGKANKPKTTDSITEVVENVNLLITDIDAIVKGQGEGPLNDTLYSLQSAIDNVNQITSDLTLLSEQLQSPEGLIPTLLASPGSTIDKLFNDNEELYGEIYGSLEGLDSTINNLVQLSSSLVGMTPEINLMLQELTVSLQEAQKVMEGLKNNPLLKGGITEEKQVKKSKTTIREEEF